MINFLFTGSPYPSLQEQADDKAFFLDKLGPFKEEFETKNGVVTFDYSQPLDSLHRIAFIMQTDPGGLGDFISRWNKYIISSRAEGKTG